MARRYFGTDGVRGVYGQDLTPDLVERLGKAATLWADGGSMLVGRDTRASGPELEAALSHGIVEADVAVAKARRQQYITGFMAALINGREEVRISKFE